MYSSSYLIENYLEDSIYEYFLLAKSRKKGEKRIIKMINIKIVNLSF